MEASDRSALYIWAKISRVYHSFNLFWILVFFTNYKLCCSAQVIMYSWGLVILVGCVCCFRADAQRKNIGRVEKLKLKPAPWGKASSLAPQAFKYIIS